MIKLALLLAMFGGITATAERDGNWVTVTPVIEGEGHFDHVKVLTARGEENIAQLPDGRWTYESAYDSGIIKGSICTPEFCEPVEAHFTVKATAAGFAYVLGLGVLAGILMNFMPCVLPVLGLKLMAASKTGGKLPYVLGVLFSFTVLATAAVVLGTGLSHMAQPWFRVILSVTCLLMGLHFLNLWHLPYFGVGKWGQLGGSFGLGVTTVALGSSCSVPFLAPILVYTSAHAWYETYALFLAVGVGFCSPFLVPFYKLLPKPGNWMLWVERTCGIALICVAGWLALTLTNGPLIGFVWLAFWSIALILQRDPWKSNAVSIVLVIVFLWGIVALYDRCFPQPTFEFTPNGKPGIVFVTADWCANCPFAHSVLESDEVQKVLRDTQGQYIELDWTNGDKAITDFLASYGVQAVPFALVVDKDGNQTVLSGVFTKEQVLEALH